MKQILLSLALCVLAGRSLADGPTNMPPLLTLANAQALALKNHPQIAAANYRALAAKENVKESRAGLFPSLNAYGDVVGTGSDDNTRILAGGINNPSVYDRIAGGLSLSQLITDFGRTANLAASSKLQSEAENQNANTTRGQVLLQVDTSYFIALEAQAVLNVAQQTFATRQLLLDQVSTLASNKLKSELDVSFARVALEEGRLLLEKARSDAEAAMTSLATALGEDQLRPIQLVEQPAAGNAGTNEVSQLVEAALADRPELLSLRYERDAALRLARSERDSRLPTVSALGVAGSSPTHDGRLPDNYTAGAILFSMPLFAGGYYTARQHAAKLRAQSATELLGAAENNVVRNVHLAWLNVQVAVEQLQTTQALARNAAEAYDLAEARYKIGSSSIVELSQAQLSLTSAQITNANALYNVLIQQANLSYQTGALH